MTFVRDIKGTWQKVAKVMGIPEGDLEPLGSAGSESWFDFDVEKNEA